VLGSPLVDALLPHPLAPRNGVVSGEDEIEVEESKTK